MESIIIISFSSENPFQSLVDYLVVTLMIILDNSFKIPQGKLISLQSL